MAEPMKGGIRDCHLARRLTSFWIKPQDYVTGAATTTLASGWSSLTCGVGNTQGTIPYLMELGRKRLWAARIATVAATLSYVWRPWDLDNRHPVYARHFWTSSSALANVATWNSVFATISSGAAIATPSTNLTRAMVGVAKDAAVEEPVMTRLGAIAALGTGAFANQTLSPEIQLVNFNFSVSSLTHGDITTAYVYLLGTEVLYTKRELAGDGSGVQGIYNEVPLSTMAAPPGTDGKIR